MLGLPPSFLSILVGPEASACWGFPHSSCPFRWVLRRAQRGYARQEGSSATLWLVFKMFPGCKQGL